MGIGVIVKLLLLLFLQYFLEFILSCRIYSFLFHLSVLIKNTSIHFLSYHIIQKLGKYINALYSRWKLGLFN